MIGNEGEPYFRPYPRAVSLAVGIRRALRLDRDSMGSRQGFILRELLLTWDSLVRPWGSAVWEG